MDPYKFQGVTAFRTRSLPRNTFTTHMPLPCNFFLCKYLYHACLYNEKYYAGKCMCMYVCMCIYLGVGEGIWVARVFLGFGVREGIWVASVFRMGKGIWVATVFLGFRLG